MSTKIYDAYEWHGGSLETLMKRLKKLRTKVHKLAIKKQIADLGPKQKGAGFGMMKFQDDLRDAMRSHEWLHIGKNKYVISNPVCSAAVYLYKGRVFVQFFGLPFKSARRVRGLRDFHYQNSSDKSANVSDRAWKERRRIWDEILGQDGRPSYAGFTFEIIQETDSSRLAMDIYEKLHGHRPWGKNDKCAICIKWRAEQKIEDEKKKQSGEAKP